MAITTTADDVTCIALQLVGQETRIEKFIEIAKLSVSESVWGAKANYDTALLTAHMLTVFDRGSGVGNDIKRKKLGDEEIEYQVSRAEDPHELATTSYGKEFLRCRRQLVLSPVLAGC